MPNENIKPPKLLFPFMAAFVQKMIASERKEPAHVAVDDYYYAPGYYYYYDYPYYRPYAYWGVGWGWGWGYPSYSRGAVGVRVYR